VREYEAYHIHSHLTNLIVPDSVVSKKSYAKRFREIGNMRTLSTCEHGWQGDIYFANDVCEDMRKDGYEIYPVQVCEAYFVLDRFEKDRTNAHLIIAAINQEGREEMNYILSEANLTGFYHRSRLDMELLMSVNPKNFIVTTACIGGVWKYPEYRTILENMKTHFGKHFFLEVQPHNTDSQKQLNRTILGLYQEGYQIIAGTDSHFIHSDESRNRDYYLESRNIVYEDEDEWILSLPDGDQLYQEFVEQGVLSSPQIEEAIANTLIFRKCNNPVHGTSYDMDRSTKMPTLYPDKTPEERIAICKRQMWDNYNRLYPNATQKEKARDIAELKYESKVLECKVGENSTIADYFLTLSDIVKRGKEYGGVLTTSGRGSAVSFFTNHLMGLTSVNRVTAPVHMYADRFVSADRIMTGSLPDVDLNMADQKPFVKAAQDIVGEWGVLPMIAYGKLKTASAWKMYSRANNVDPALANEISKGLQRYEAALKYAKEEYGDEDMEEDTDYGVSLENYVPQEYLPMVVESRSYMGVIDNYSPHPCAHIVVNDDIRRKIGVIRLKGSKNDGEVAAIIDGATAERYGYLKVDFLLVDVVKIIKNAFDSIGLPVPSENELLAMTNGDTKTWEMYAKGYTMGLNQVEREATTERVMKYKPQNAVELAAFVAAVRPGFKSMLETFISRKPFQYNIPALDNLLSTEEIPDSFLIYQEQVMKVLQAAGISASESYNCIKAISKKNPDKIASYKSAFMEGFTHYIMDKDGLSEHESREASEVVWGIVEDNASYSFNISHAYCVGLDSLYCAWLKAHHPYELYMVLLRNYAERGDKDRIALLKNEMFSAYGIRMVPPRFRTDNRDFESNKEEGLIRDALSSTKYIGKATAEALYTLRDGQFDTFVDLLATLNETNGVNKRHIDILIRTNYFQEFGERRNLLAIYNEFFEGESCYKKTYVDKTKQARLAVLREFESNVNSQDVSPVETVAFEVEHLGIPTSVWENSRMSYAVIDVDDKYTPKIHLSNLKNEKTGVMKIKKAVFASQPVKPGDIIHIMDWRQAKAFTTKDGFSVPPAKWIEVYEVFSKDKPYRPERLNLALGLTN
jgi:DNA polymerase III alpha subunit